MKFHSLLERRNTSPAPAGEEFEQEYIEKIDENGHKYLEESGQTNIYDRIQASHEETKIYNIIKRYEQGDETALDRVTGMYIDSTGMPKSLMEAHQRIAEIENAFEKLPLEIRADFNHNPSEFISRMSSGTGMEVFEKHTQKIEKREEKTKTEEKTNEQE